MKKFVMGFDAPDAATHVLTWSTPSPWALLAPDDVVIPVDAALHTSTPGMAVLAGSILGYPVTLVEQEPGHPVPFYFVIPAGGGR